MARIRLQRSSLVLIIVLIALAVPVTAWADGPVPPRNLFQAPPTPTPAPLPPPKTPPLTATPRPEREIPPEGASSVFLPLVGSVTTSWSTAAALPADANTHKDDPLTASFTYTIREGDTLSDLAIEFGRDLRTMSCVRNEDGSPVKRLQVGENIVVPALSDLCHKVKQGETLAKIATWYGVSADSLLNAPENNLQSESDVRAGQHLLIPNARSRYRDPTEIDLDRPQKAGWSYGDGNFIWPIERRLTWISQGFRHGKHMAVDLATREGVKVRAADTGKVIKAGWSDNGYGYRIVIDHGIDYVTLYAHLSEYYVEEGDIVQKGEVIGAVGSTGNSTGPHLHFEVRDYGYLIDPLLVLP